MAEIHNQHHAPHHPVAPAKLPPATTGDPGYGLGIAAFVVSFFVGVAGLVMGIIAVKQSKAVGKRNTLGFAGFIIGIVKTALDILAVAGAIVFGVWVTAYCSSHQSACQTHGSSDYQYNQDYRNQYLPDTPDSRTY